MNYFAHHHCKGVLTCDSVSPENDSHCGFSFTDMYTYLKIISI